MNGAGKLPRSATRGYDPRMALVLQPWQTLVAALAGWITRQQDAVIEYLREENRVLEQQVGHKRLRLTDDQRRRLAVRGKAIGLSALAQVASIVTPDTILRWHRQHVAEKWTPLGSRRRGAEATPRGPQMRNAVGDIVPTYRTLGGVPQLFLPIRAYADRFDHGGRLSAPRGRSVRPRPALIQTEEPTFPLTHEPVSRYTGRGTGPRRPGGAS